MATRLTFLCHAPTSATRRAAFPDDEAIEAMGAAEAARLSASLGSPTRILRAPALAARQTAEALGLSPGIDIELRECDHGRWRGRSLAEVRADEPAGLARWIADPDFDGHGGELIARLVLRARSWLGVLGENSGRVLAVTHASVVRAAIVAAIGASADVFWRIDVAPLTLVELRGGSGRWSLRRVEPLK